MKKIAVLSVTLILAASLAVYAGEEEPKVFHGEISDSQCALNVHSLTKSHQEMLKSKSGAMGDTAASCSLYCISHMGGKFVLVSKGHVYHLDGQELPLDFLGKKVKLRGTLDSKIETIHVVKIDQE